MLKVMTTIRASISLRVLLYLSVPGVVVFIVFAAVSLSYVRQAAERDYARNAAGVVRTIKALVATEDIMAPEHFQNVVERIIRNNDHIVKLHLHLPRGRGAYTAVSTQHSEIGHESNRHDSEPLRTGKEVTVREGSIIEIHTPIIKQGRPVAVVGLYMSTKEEQARLAELTKQLLALGALVAAVMAASVYFTISRLVLTPLHRLERSTKKLALGSYDPVLVGKEDELGHLAKHFNIMLETIAEKEQETNMLYGKLERSYQQVRSQAITDELTGLYNMRYCRARLEEEVSRAGRSGLPIALAFLDIDDFKRFNDVYGHQAGDSALRAVAGVLRQQIRGGDFAARYGGEELVIVFPETTAEQATAICERIRLGVNDLRFEGGGERAYRLSVSIGIAAYPADGEAGVSLISVADKRMYKGKGNGKNQVVSPSSSRTRAAAPRSPA